jgi:hypothetical protein
MATAVVVRVAGVAERHPVTHDAGPNTHHAPSGNKSRLFNCLFSQVRDKNGHAHEMR